MIQYVVIFSLLLFSLISFSAFGEVVEITTDKSAYYDGDTILVSGIISTELPVTSISVVIFDPDRSTFVAVAPAMSNADGSFSVSIHVGGPLWGSYGNYPIQATSENTSKETVVEYLESTVSSTQEPTQEPIQEPTSNATPAPELKIPARFVDESKSPQSYVDRYYNEINYKEWFDANYPQYSSIYEAVGLEEPVFMPDWIRNNAGWWATGSIPDSTFVTGIEFMLENNIIVISNIPSSENIPNDKIPQWIRNNADWWSQEKISDDEFVNSLKYLIQEGIIVIN
jgi:hypothetical protein